ncbi:hypothetical protein LT493_00875 [Streptomyces tricolor]|nr:hypothetical protein [Streptomyces tricolor]
MHAFGRATLVRGDGTAPCGPDGPLSSATERSPSCCTRRALRTASSSACRGTPPPSPTARCGLSPTGRPAPTARWRPLLGPLPRTFLGTPPEYAPRTALRLATTITGFVGLPVEDAAEAADATHTAHDVPDRRDAQDPGPEPAQEHRELLHRVRAYVDARLWDRDADARHRRRGPAHPRALPAQALRGPGQHDRPVDPAPPPGGVGSEVAAPESAGLAASGGGPALGLRQRHPLPAAASAPAYGMAPRDWRSCTRPSQDPPAAAETADRPELCTQRQASVRPRRPCRARRALG